MGAIFTDEPHADLVRTTAFGAWLTEQRLALRLTQTELAYHCGMNAGRIAEAETGRKKKANGEQIVDWTPGPGMAIRIWDGLQKCGATTPPPDDGV